MIDRVVVLCSGIVLGQGPRDVMDIGIIDIGMPSGGEDALSEIQHRLAKIAVKSVEIRHPKRTAVSKPILVLPVVRPVIASILRRPRIMNKAVARNGTAEVCINLVLKLGPVPLEVGTIQIRPRLHVQYDAGDAAVDRDEDPCRPEKWNRQKRDEQTNRPLCECCHRPAPHIGSIAAVWVRMTAEPRSGVKSYATGGALSHCRTSTNLPAIAAAAAMAGDTRCVRPL